MKLTKERIRNIILFILLTFVLFSLSGCRSNYVSEKTILEDLKRDELFSVHSVEIENFEIIKRLSNEEQDSIFLNVKGRNSIYSISLNYKMVYLPYNDGWLIETIEQYEDNGEFVNEIMPLNGPSQEVIDEFTTQYDWKSVASFSGWLEQDVTWELTPTEEVSLERFYGRAKYICTAVCEYPYIRETVTFPVYFYFSSVSSDDYYAWHTYSDENVLSETERVVELKPSICKKWLAEGTVSNGFRSAYVKTGFHIKEIYPYEDDPTLHFASVDSYYFYDGDDNKRYEASGKMRLVSNKDQETGKISSLKLLFFADSDNPPMQCADLYFDNSKALRSAFEYSLGIFEYPIRYTAQG